MKILIAGFQHETNTFALNHAGWNNFLNGEGFPPMHIGDDVLKMESTNIPIGGFIQESKKDGHHLIPVIWAAACPSGLVEEEAYESIVSLIINKSIETTPDAIYLDLHGAMVSSNIDDGEGELIKRLRKIVGWNVPIIVSLDLHANVTTQMMQFASGLVAFRTYPHVDMANTGKLAYKLLVDIISNNSVFSHHQKTPFLIPINSMCTLHDPAKSIYEELKELEKTDGIFSLSFTPGFPASDIEECGPMVWGYGKDKICVEKIVNKLYKNICSNESKWCINFLSPEDAVTEAISLSKTVQQPIIIADPQDNPGSGGSSDTTGILHELIKKNVDSSIGLIYDPQAVLIALNAGVGNSVYLSLGGKSDKNGDKPLEGIFFIERFGDGKCTFEGPMLTGTEVDVGPIVTLRKGKVKIIVSTGKSQMLDQNLFKMGGIYPEKENILVVKSAVHFRADFGNITNHILIAKAPGEMKIDCRDLPWKKLDKGIRLYPQKSST